MVIIYLAAFVIRPWEVLFLELMEGLHFERWLAITVLVVVVLAGRLRLPTDRTAFAVYIFMASAAIAMVFGVNPAKSWYTFYILFTVFVFFVMLVSAVRSEYDLVFTIACYVVIMGTYLAKSLWEYFIYGGYESEQGYKRLMGIERSFGDPNSLGPGIVFSLPFLLFLFYTRHSFTANWTPLWRKWFTRGLLAYAVLAVVSVLMTRSRSGVLCLVVFLILQANQSPGLGKKVARLALVAVLCVTVFTFIPADMQRRIRTIWDPSAGTQIEHESAMGRLEGFQAGITIFKQHPVTGIGPGNFGVYRFKNVDGSYMHAHNLLGQLLAESGLVGALGFGILLLSMYSTCRRLILITSVRDDELSNVLNKVVLAFRDVVTLMLFSGIFQHNLYRFNWLWIAAFLILAKESLTRHLKQSSAFGDARIAGTPAPQWNQPLLVPRPLLPQGPASPRALPSVVSNRISGRQSVGLEE